MSEYCEEWVRAYVAGGIVPSTLPCRERAVALALRPGPDSQPFRVCARHLQRRGLEVVVLHRDDEGAA